MFVKVPLSILRKKYCILCSGYLDDSIFLNMSGSMLQKEFNTAIELLQSLGFMISSKKSVIVPTTRLEYLGFVIDTIDMSVTLPSQKVANLLNLVNMLRRKQVATIRMVAQVIGSLTAARHATRFSLLFTKRWKSKKLRPFGPIEGTLKPK